MPAVCAPAAPPDRGQLLALAGQADSYRFLQAALPAIQQQPEDWDVQLQIVRHYTMLGLIGPALESLRAMPPEVQQPLAAADVPRQLERMPDGRIPWEQRSACFEANRQALLQRRPDLAGLLEAARRGLDAIELYRCRDGNYQLRAVTQGGRCAWLPRLSDHRKDSPWVEIPRSAGVNMPPPLLIEGLHFGWFLPPLLAATRNLFLSFSPAVYLLEPNPLNLAAVLHMHDWRELLADERLYLFAGADAPEQFTRTLESREDLPLPQQQTRLASWGAERPFLIEPAVTALQKMRVTRAAALREQVRCLYSERDAAWWARRYARAGPADPLRILLPVSRYTTYLKYCIRDVAAAFERQGMSARVLIEPTDHSNLSAIEYLRMLLDFRPDLVLTIDHFRREYIGVIPEQVPFVGWIQDQLPHLYSRECGESLGPLDFFVAPDPTCFVHQYGYPASQGLAWTMSTDDKVYSGEPLPEEELAAHRCDFSYVSHQASTPRAFLEARRAAFGEEPRLSRYMECLYGLLLRDFAADPRTGCLKPAHQLLDEVTRRTGCRIEDPASLDQLILFFLHPLAELMFRQGTLEWVADYCDRTGRTLHIYGNGWERHPRFARYARGPAGNGRELRAIYQASRVNLQIIGGGCIHPRLLDGLLSGGFFLIRHTPFDVLHEAIRETLAAVDRYSLQPDTDYPADRLPEFAEAVRRLAALQGWPAPAAQVRLPAGYLRSYREQAAQGYRRVGAAVLPDYAQVSFSSAGEFTERAERFLNDPQSRTGIVAGMRAVVKEHYTYASLVERLLVFIRERLSASADSRDEDRRTTAVRPAVVEEVN